MPEEKQEQEPTLIETLPEPLETPSEFFEDIRKYDLLKVLKLYVSQIYDDTTKGLLGLLTDAQKTDLTDSGATTLHKHDHGGMDGLLDDDHTQYMKDLVDDTTPQLGGDLDMNSKGIDFPTTANITDVKDEDNMASDSATMLATQQSIKKYVDNNSISLTTASALSETLQHSNDTARAADNDAYTKVKEIKLNEALPTFRIKCDVTEAMAVMVYKNGVTVSTEQTTGGSPPYTLTFDFTGTNFTTNDLIQIYAHRLDAGTGNTISNMRFCFTRTITKIGDNTIITPIPITFGTAPTNQDP